MSKEPEKMDRRNYVKYVATGVAGLAVGAAAGYLGAGGGAPAPPGQVMTVTETRTVTQTAAAPTPAGFEPEGSFTIATLGGPRHEMALRAVAERYMKAFPKVKIDFELGTWDSHFAKMAVELAAGTGKYPVFTQDPEMFNAPWVVSGYLEPLGKYMTGTQLEDVHEDAPAFALEHLWQSSTPHKTDPPSGHYYGLPIDSNAQLFWYRKSVLEEAGWSKPPDTIQEFFECCKAIHNPPKMYAAAYNMLRFWAAEAYLSLTFTQGTHFWPGAPWMVAGKPRFDTEPFIRSAEIIRDLYKYCPPEALTWTEMECATAVGTTGNVAMAPYGWGLPVYTDPKLSPLADDIGIGARDGPVLKDEVTGGRASALGGFSFAMDAHAPEKLKPTLWHFMWNVMSREYMSYSPYTYTTNTGQPGRISALSLDYAKMGLVAQRYYGPLAEAMKIAGIRPHVPAWKDIHEMLGIRLGEIAQGRDVKEGMRKLNDETIAVLNKYDYPWGLKNLPASQGP